MSPGDLHKAPSEEKQRVFKITADKINLQPFAVEKDWWVVQTLRVIFNMPAGKHLLFKGGTSLSKAWKILNRFSEDIDLALNREYLGFDSGMISKSQVRKLRSKSFQFITGTFKDDLKSAFDSAGMKEVQVEFENLGDGDQDPISILVFYPHVTNHPEYIEPRVKVEIGSRSLKDPFTNRSFQSLVGESFPGMPLTDEKITIPCINPERTFLEKLFLLHEEFQKPARKIRVNRLSRHLYDIHVIAQSKYSKRVFDPVLIKNIIIHRERFNKVKGVEYKMLYPPRLNALPPKSVAEAWKQDYLRMRDQMIYGESPGFDELIQSVQNQIDTYNRIKTE